MSGSEPRRLITPVALLLLAVIGCGASERESTLPSDGQQANPAPVELDLPPATPATLSTYVEEKARALSERPYSPPAATVPSSLAALDYAQYRSIRFRPEAALWRGEAPFTVQLLHPGYLFGAPVRLHVVDEEHVRPIPFDARLFNYGNVRRVGDAAGDLGYSGFRVHYPVNDPKAADEVAVFQGASYFRLLGPGHVHGLSSRGLALGIGEPGEEEFPSFVEFWLVKPGRGARELVFHALLDGPSVTGAYRFRLQTGAATVLDVDARLFARHDVEKLGVAPLSSMFLYGANRSGEYDDFRPEVHDSDGLLMLTHAREWIWRPLSNRRELRMTELRDTDPRGFGLVQRARDFERYLDLETRYHRRPSEWVEVEGEWGVGGVELLEAPTDSEFSDNIAVSWVPDAPFEAGEERRYRYRLVTFDERMELQTLAQVERTRIGWDALPGATPAPPRSQRRFVVDFTGGSLADVGGEAEVQAIIYTTSGEISDLSCTPLPSSGEWRVSFRLVPDGTEPADLRLHLELEDRRVSETWSYVWYPDELR